MVLLKTHLTLQESSPPEKTTSGIQSNFRLNGVQNYVFRARKSAVIRCSATIMIIMANSGDGVRISDTDERLKHYN
jgi:hypothetical protein